MSGQDLQRLQFSPDGQIIEAKPVGQTQETEQGETLLGTTGKDLNLGVNALMRQIRTVEPSKSGTVIEKFSP